MIEAVTVCERYLVAVDGVGAAENTNSLGHLVRLRARVRLRLRARVRAPG